MADTKVKMQQDACEIQTVYLIQKELEFRGKNKNSNSSEIYKKLLKYVNDRPALKGMDELRKCAYFKNNVKYIPGFVNRLISKFPNSTFSVEDVEKEYRNLNLKGDFLIKVHDNDEQEISFSLKNYEKSCNTIQTCSGTYISFVNNFIFTPNGVGYFTNPLNGERFKGSDIDVRNNILSSIGYKSIISHMNNLDELGKQIKKKYVHGDKAEYWKNISADWKNDCEYYGEKAIENTLLILKSFSKEEVTSRLLKMIGFDGKEELLLIDQKGSYDSFTSDSFNALLHKIRNSEVSFDKKGKSISFSFVDDANVILETRIPYTINANGAWYRPKIKYSGAEWHSKEKCYLHHGQRRPKKSRELAPSINTYVELGKTGVLNEI
jgi:hypothetical protein